MSNLQIMIPDEELRRWVGAALQAFNDHDLDAWMAFYAPDGLHDQPGLVEPLRGKERIKEDYRVSTWTPFPDFKFELSRAFGQGPWICLEGTFTGTHLGPLDDGSGEPVPPTHRAVRVPICLVVRVEQGLAVEVHEYNDRLGFLTQLGLLVS